jgi:hypothetical protein
VFINKNPHQHTFSFASAAHNNIPIYNIYKNRPTSLKPVPPFSPSLNLIEPQALLCEKGHSAQPDMF